MELKSNSKIQRKRFKIKKPILDVGFLTTKFSLFKKFIRIV